MKERRNKNYHPLSLLSSCSEIGAPGVDLDISDEDEDEEIEEVSFPFFKNSYTRVTCGNDSSFLIQPLISKGRRTNHEF